MVIAYIALAVVAAAANTWAAATDFLRTAIAVNNATKVEVPLSRLSRSASSRLPGQSDCWSESPYRLIGVAAAIGLITLLRLRGLRPPPRPLIRHDPLSGGLLALGRWRAADPTGLTVTAQPVDVVNCRSSSKKDDRARFHDLGERGQVLRDLGPTAAAIDHRVNTHAKKRNHLRQLEALGYRVILEPAA